MAKTPIADDPNTRAKFADLFTNGRALLTLTLILSVGSHATNLFVTRTVLPTIVADIGGKEMMYWVLALFQIAAIVGGMGAAQIKAKLGGRHTIYLAAVLLVVGSCFAGFANHFSLLVFGRGIQGFAEGMLISLAYIILSESYKNNLMTRMIGLLGIVWAAAALVGPLIAGSLEGTFGWRSVFLVNLFIAGLLITQSRIAVEQNIENQSKNPIPILRLLVFVIAVSGICLTGQLTQATQIATVLAVSATILFFAIKIDKQANNRLLPASLFAVKGSVGLGVWISITISVPLGGHAVYMVALLQSIWQLSPMNAGYVASILAATWSFVAWGLSGINTLENQLKSIRIGVALISLSFLLIAAGLFSSNLIVVFAGLAITGAGLGAAMMFLDKKIMHAASKPEKDRTSSMLPPIDSAASAIGAAFASIMALSLGLFGGTPTFGIIDTQVAIDVAPVLYLIFFAFSLPAMVMSFLLPLDDSNTQPSQQTATNPY